MDELLGNETFLRGVGMGMALCQQKIITAHKCKKPLIVGDTLYYLQDGRECLAELLEKVCR